MKEKYDMTFAEAQDLEAKTNLDTYWNDEDIVIDTDHITQTIGNVLQFGMDYQKEIDDAILKAKLVGAKRDGRNEQKQVQRILLEKQKQELIIKAKEWWNKELREVNYGTYDEAIEAFEMYMEE